MEPQVPLYGSVHHAREMPTEYPSSTRLCSETMKSQWHTEESQGGTGVEQIWSWGLSQYSFNIHLQNSWLGTNLPDAAGSLRPCRGDVIWGQLAGKKILSHSCQPDRLTYMLRNTLLSWCGQGNRPSSLTRKIWMQQCLNAKATDTKTKPAPCDLKLWRMTPRNLEVMHKQ